nr:MAG TPA: Protein of unknown function (DUF1804) [Caudoviricetes sp.]
MRERYEAGGISLRALAAEYGVTERAVSQHARDEEWRGPRRWSRMRGTAAQSSLTNVARQLYRAATSAAGRMDLGEADVKEIKELAALLQALMGLEKAMEPPKPVEKQKKETVRVVLSDEAEELSR